MIVVLAGITSLPLSGIAFGKCQPTCLSIGKQKDRHHG